MIKTIFYITDLDTYTDSVEVPFRFQKDDVIRLYEIFNLSILYGVDEEGCIKADPTKRHLHYYMVENTWHSCDMVCFGFEEGKFTQHVWLSEYL